MFLQKVYFWGLVVILLITEGCKTSLPPIKDGDSASSLNLYSTGVVLYEKEFSAEKDLSKKKDIAEKIADTYVKINNISSAEKWYKTCIELNGRPETVYKLAMMQKRQERYDDAIRNFELYQRISGTAFEGRKQANQCKDARDWRKAISRYSLQNLSINTSADDYKLAPFGKDTFVFTSNISSNNSAMEDGWMGKSFQDIYTTIKNGSTFSTPTPFEEFNGLFHESSVTFSADFQEAYFIRCNADEKSNQYCQLYYSNRVSGKWQVPIKIELLGDTANIYDPCLSRDGTQLYFVSDALGGFGKTDIYVVSKTASSLGVPQNLGSIINTPGSERFPWLDERDNLYFSSDGQPGMGGLDVFRAPKLKGGFKEPVNLRYPINSGYDDFGFYISKYKPVNEKDTILSSGYLTSNRPGGKGGDDIYMFNEVWFNEFVLRVNTFENKYEVAENPESKIVGLQKLPKVKFELNSETTGNAVFVTNDTGYYFTRLGRSMSDYQLSATKPGYFAKTIKFSTNGLATKDSIFVVVNVDVTLEKIFPQREIVIPNIYYDYDKATLRDESKVVLDSILNFFKENPDLQIEIGSHTDSRGSDAYNLKLSQARAQSVVDYLITKGVEQIRLQAKGYGETKPVNSCVNGANCSEEEFQKNRRTTFRVVSSKLNLESIEPEDIRVDPKDK